MNANLTLSEIVTIAVIILIVFGPQRLPEMARRAGELVGKLRQAAATVRDELTREYEGISKPLVDIERELSVAKDELRAAIPRLDEPVVEPVPHRDGGNGPPPAEGAGETPRSEAAAPSPAPEPAADGGEESPQR